MTLPWMLRSGETTCTWSSSSFFIMALLFCCGWHTQLFLLIPRTRESIARRFLSGQQPKFQLMGSHLRKSVKQKKTIICFNSSSQISVRTHLISASVLIFLSLVINHLGFAQGRIPSIQTTLSRHHQENDKCLTALIGVWYLISLLEHSYSLTESDLINYKISAISARTIRVLKSPYSI